MPGKHRTQGRGLLRYRTLHPSPVPFGSVIAWIVVLTISLHHPHLHVITGHDLSGAAPAAVPATP